jgi:hypothetical protein
MKTQYSLAELLEAIKSVHDYCTDQNKYFNTSGMCIADAIKIVENEINEVIEICKEKPHD